MFTGSRGNYETNAASQLTEPLRTVGPQMEHISEACNMTPNHLQGKDYRPKPKVDRGFLNNCIQSPPGRNKILLVGDSFAQVSAPYIAVIARRLGYDFRAIYGYVCPYPLNFDAIKSSAQKSCPEVDNQVLVDGLMNGLNAGDLLVIRLFLPNPIYLRHAYGGLPPAEAYDVSLSTIFAAALSKGAQVLVIGANPVMDVGQQQLLEPQ